MVYLVAMAKLSAEVLEQGRERVRNADLEGLISWTKTHASLMDEGMIRRTFSKVFHWKDTEKALRMFDAGFVDYDPEKDARGILLRLGVILLLLLGALGGVVYLFRACTGL